MFEQKKKTFWPEKNKHSVEKNNANNISSCCFAFFLFVLHRLVQYNGVDHQRTTVRDDFLGG